MVNGFKGVVLEILLYITQGQGWGHVYHAPSSHVIPVIGNGSSTNQQLTQLEHRVPVGYINLNYTITFLFYPCNALPTATPIFSCEKLDIPVHVCHHYVTSEML